MSEKDRKKNDPRYRPPKEALITCVLCNRIVVGPCSTEPSVCRAGASATETELLEHNCLGEVTKRTPIAKGGK